MHTPSVLDLVSHGGVDLVVIGADELSLRLAAPDWPPEFSEFDVGGIGEVIVVDRSEVTLVTPASDRLEVFNDRLRAVGDNADEAQGWDWTEVNELLATASSIIPRHLLAIDPDFGRWSLSDDVPADLVATAQPAAQILATHAIGAGEADTADLSAALELARGMKTPAPRP